MDGGEYIDANEIEIDENETQDIINVAHDQDNKEGTNKVNLGPLLGAHKSQVYSNNPAIQLGALPLRECNSNYGKYGGIKFENSFYSEFDRCYTVGCISPLRRFHNAVGHFVTGLKIPDTVGPSVLCYRPEIVDSLSEFSDGLRTSLSSSLRDGYLWNILGTQLCYQTRSGSPWSFGSTILNSKISSAIDLVSISFPEPLSFHSQHAWYEAADRKDIMKSVNIYKQPQETSAVPGLLGTFHNNQVIDLAQEDDKDNIDIEARNKDSGYLGFVCGVHTAHSTEAGRVKRLAEGTFIRILNKDMMESLYKVCELAEKHNSGPKQWLLWCMGYMVKITTKALCNIRNLLIALSSTEANFATIHVNEKYHVAIISISSGVVLKRDINGLLSTTISEYLNSWPDGKHSIQFPAHDSQDALKFYFSTYARLVPYIGADKAPRPLIASVQSIQAVSTPYGAGTSSVQPTQVTMPLVTTPLADELMPKIKEKNTWYGAVGKPDILSDNFGLADTLPGMNLMIGIANFNDTNEDSIMISDGSVARGLYSYLAYSAHSISSSEDIPEVGKYAHIVRNRWWKTWDRRQKTEPKAVKVGTTKEKRVPLLAGGDGRGKIVSKAETQTGDISVRVLRYSNVVSGDKLASLHGQKGTVKLIKEKDMPYGFTEGCGKDAQPEIIKFDIIISVSSLVNRITMGQYYEMISGAIAAKEGRTIVVDFNEVHSQHKETVLYDGPSGMMIPRQHKIKKRGEWITGDEHEGDLPVLASWGISRISQMTQQSFDKQHYTHNSAGGYTISTKQGRTAGGGVKFGEMETQACAGSGLRESRYELKLKGDCIDTPICVQCKALAAQCRCNTDKHFSMCSIPHSAVVFALTTLVTHGVIMKFEIG